MSGQLGFRCFNITRPHFSRLSIDEMIDRYRLNGFTHYPTRSIYLSIYQSISISVVAGWPRVSLCPCVCLRKFIGGAARLGSAQPNVRCVDPLSNRSSSWLDRGGARLVAARREADGRGTILELAIIRFAVAPQAESGQHFEECPGLWRSVARTW